MELSTKYLGMQLTSPLVAGACGLATDVQTVKKLEAAGAGMVVMHSLFEEQYAVERSERGWAMEHGSSSELAEAADLPATDDFALQPDEYCAQIAALKAAVRIPIVGSVNGSTPGNWVLYATRMEEAGADAIELNIYDPTMDTQVTAGVVEERVVEVVKLVRRAIKVPLAVKLSPFYSSFANLALRLDGAGADGIVLFNRFYQPDIDVQKMEVNRSLNFSTSGELLLRLRWAAALCGKIRGSIAITGGVHNGNDAIKSILAGADVVQMASAIIQHGPEHLSIVSRQIQDWLNAQGVTSLGAIRGKLSVQESGKPAAYERLNYVNIIAGKK